jgi:hypothetical protein
MFFLSTNISSIRNYFIIKTLELPCNLEEELGFRGVLISLSIITVFEPNHYRLFSYLKLNRLLISQEDMMTHSPLLFQLKLFARL